MPMNVDGVGRGDWVGESPPLGPTPAMGNPFRFGKTHGDTFLRRFPNTAKDAMAAAPADMRPESYDDAFHRAAHGADGEAKSLQEADAERVEALDDRYSLESYLRPDPEGPSMDRATRSAGRGALKGLGSYVTDWKNLGFGAAYLALGAATTLAKGKWALGAAVLGGKAIALFQVGDACWKTLANAWDAGRQGDWKRLESTAARDVGALLATMGANGLLLLAGNRLGKSAANRAMAGIGRAVP